MESGLVQIYRVVYSDLVLICDALGEYFRLSNTNKSVTEFADGLSFLLRVEHDLDKRELKYAALEKWQDSKNKGEHSPVGFAYEFFHGVFVQFVCEELSQYPFWLIKIAAINSSSPVSIISIIQQKLRNGRRFPLFKGCIPYVAAAFIQSYSQFETILKRFLLAIGSRLPKPNSIVFLGGSGSEEKLIKNPPKEVTGSGKEDVQDVSSVSFLSHSFQYSNIYRYLFKPRIFKHVFLHFHIISRKM